jgi:hypothetical protein
MNAAQLAVGDVLPMTKIIEPRELRQRLISAIEIANNR